MKTQWVWVKSPLERAAEVLEEGEEMVVVVPDVADAFVFAGVNILDKGGDAEGGREVDIDAVGTR